MGRTAKPKKNAAECPHTDRIAHAKGICKSCYDQSVLTPEAIAKINTSDGCESSKAAL
jgi:hypothetical protein